MIRATQRRRRNFTVDGERLVRAANEGDPQHVRIVWKAFHDVALAHYTRTKAPDPEMEARNIGWRAVRLYLTQPGVVGWYHNGYKVGWGHSEAIADPGTLPVLGKLMEITFLTREGGFGVIAFREPNLPDLAWDKKNKRLLCYPKLPRNVMRDKDIPRYEQEAAKMFETWHSRPPGYGEIYNPGTIRVQTIGAVDCVTYRSDKWNKANPNTELRGSAEYLHQDDLGIFVEVSNPRQPAQSDLIVVQGGKLDALAAGLIH